MEGLASEQPRFVLAQLGGADHLVVDSARCPAALGPPLPPVEQQARRNAAPAPTRPTTPGCSVSSTDHHWRRCAEVITSVRWTSGIALRLDSRLGPHAMPPVRSNGAAPLRVSSPRFAGA